MLTTTEPPPPTDILGRPVVARDPNASHFAVPHFLTFNSIFNGTSRAYWAARFDEAMRNSREDALAMRRDAFYHGLLRERKEAVSGLTWHIKVPDEKDPEQKLVQETLTAQLERTLGLTRAHESLLEAIWYGRYGIQPRWKWFPPTRQSQGRRVFGLDDWYPVNGDKINHRWDGTPMIQINPIKAAEFSEKGAEITVINLGTYLVLSRQWREYLIVHKHEIDDADYYEAELAEGRFGVGVRSRIYWLDFLKREFLEWITSYMERVGLGITLWYYDAGNPDAEAAVDKAAGDQSRRAILKVPVWRDAKGGTKGLVERIETPTSGVEALRSLIDYFDAVIERYIVGQEGSTSATSSSGHSNQASSEFMRNTKERITVKDARLLGETYTGSEREPGLLSVMQRWTFPETFGKFQAQWVFAVDDESSESKVQSARTLWEMGIALKADEVRNAGGFSKPGEGDEIVQKPAEQPQGPGGPGAPGAAPGGPGGPGGGVGPDGQPLPEMSGVGGPDQAVQPDEDQAPDQGEPGQGGSSLMRLLGYSRGQWTDEDGALHYAWTKKGQASDGKRFVWYDPDTKQRRVQISEPGTRGKARAAGTTAATPQPSVTAQPRNKVKPTLANAAALVEEFRDRGGDVGDVAARLSLHTVAQLKALGAEIQASITTRTLKGERVRKLAERILAAAMGPPQPRGQQANEQQPAPATDAGAQPAFPGEIPEPKEGEVMEFPALGNRRAFALQVEKLDDDNAWLKFPGSDYTAVKIPRESLRQWRNDMAGVVNVPPTGDDPTLDAVIGGKARLLGHGDDGMAFEVGDKIVKVSSVVPFHPTNSVGQRTPEQAIDQARRQFETAKEMHQAGVPGIPKQSVRQVGDKVFTTRQKLDIPERFTPDQVEQVRQLLNGMHQAGFSLNDDIQVGIGADGKVYHYDTGKAARATHPEDYADDSDRFERWAEKNGTPVRGLKSKAEAKFASHLDRWKKVADSDPGNKLLTAPRTWDYLDKQRRAIIANDPSRADEVNKQVEDLQRQVGITPPERSPVALANHPHVGKAIESIQNRNTQGGTLQRPDLTPEQMEQAAQDHFFNDEKLRDLFDNHKQAGAAVRARYEQQLRDRPGEPEEDNNEAFKAIADGDTGYIDGYRVSRQGRAYRLDTDRGHVTGTPKEIREAIHWQQQHDVMERDRINAARERHQQGGAVLPLTPAWAAQDRAFGNLTNGTEVAITEGNHQGRHGVIVRDSSGAPRVKLAGTPGLVPVTPSAIEPLDPKHSWRVPPESGPGGLRDQGPRQGGLFDAPAEEEPAASGTHTASLPGGQEVAFNRGRFRQDPAKYDVVEVDPKQLDSLWSRNRSNHLPAGGTGSSEKPGARLQAADFIASGKPVDMPEVNIDASGNLMFDDGRHRFAALRDAGIDKVPVVVPKKKAAELQKRLQEAKSSRQPATTPDVKRLGQPEESDTYHSWLNGPNADKPLIDTSTRGPDSGVNSIGGGASAAFMKDLNRELGYDAKPQVVGSSDIDKLIAQGATPLYRGVPDAKHIEDFKRGDFFAGIGGNGNGTYAVKHNSDESNGYDEAVGYTQTATSGEQPRNVMRMVFKPGARVADQATYLKLKAEQKARIKDLYDRRRGERDPVKRKLLDRQMQLLGDLGAYAAMKGYDALDNGHMVILNRGAVVVQDEPAQPPRKGAVAANPTTFNPAAHLDTLKAAVAKHGASRGNLAHLHHVRGDLGHLSREQQDAVISHGLRTGAIGGSALEGREGNTPEQRAAAHGQGDQRLGYLSLRQE